MTDRYEVFPSLRCEMLEEGVRDLASLPVTAVAWTKYSLNNWYRQAGPLFDASLGYEFFGFGLPEAREGLAALKEKRPPDFRAAEEQSR